MQGKLYRPFPRGKTHGGAEIASATPLRPEKLAKHLRNSEGVWLTSLDAVLRFYLYTASLHPCGGFVGFIQRTGCVFTFLMI